MRKNTIIILLLLIFCGFQTEATAKDGAHLIKLIEKGAFVKWIKKWEKRTIQNPNALKHFRFQATTGLDKLLKQTTVAYSKNDLSSSKDIAENYTYLCTRIAFIDSSYFKDESVDYKGKLPDIKCLPYVINARKLFERNEYVKAFQDIEKCNSDLNINTREEFKKKFTQIKWDQYTNLKKKGSLIEQAKFLAKLDYIFLELLRANFPLTSFPCPEGYQIMLCQNFNGLVDKNRSELISQLENSADYYFNCEEFKKSFQHLHITIQIAKGNEEKRLREKSQRLFQFALNLLNDRLNNFIKREKWRDAIDLLPKFVEVDPSYPLNKNRSRLETIRLYIDGINSKRNSDCEKAEKEFTKALYFRNKAGSICQECPSKIELNTQLKEAKDCRGIRLLKDAEVAYKNGDYVSAVLLIDQAKKLIAVKEKYQYLYKKALSKAKKNIGISFKQSSTTKKFSSSQLKKLENIVKQTLGSQLTNSYIGKFFDLTNYYDADYVIEIDITHINYQAYKDEDPTIHTYCTLSKRFGYDQCGRLIYWYVPNELVKVKKYNDRAKGEIGFTINLTNTKYYKVDSINENWKQEAWRSHADPLTLAYYSCPFHFISDKDRRNFKRSRSIPDKESLLFDSLEKSLNYHISKIKKVLDQLLNDQV